MWGKKERKKNTQQRIQSQVYGNYAHSQEYTMCVVVVVVVVVVIIVVYCIVLLIFGLEVKAIRP